MKCQTTLLLKNLLLTRLSLFATLFIAHFSKISNEMNRKCARVMTRVIAGHHFNPDNVVTMVTPRPKASIFQLYGPLFKLKGPVLIISHLFYISIISFGHIAG